MQKNKDPQLTDSVSPAWDKFLQKSKEQIPTEEWKLAHILGHWYSIYEKQYGRTYTINFSQPPGKSFDVLRIKSIANNISSDPVILRDYIDWVFNEKVIKNKLNIKTLAVLVKDEYINEYKERLTMTNKPIDRSTPIPPNFANVIKAHNQPFKTYGELAYARKAGSEYQFLFDNLSKVGFNLSVLDKVK